MAEMLTIDNVRFQLWTPDNEEKFEELVIRHTNDIFGKYSEYFDFRRKLSSRGGIGSIPDGYIVNFGDRLSWYVLEIEISSHSLYDHIVPQMHRFINGLKNPTSRKELIDAVYDEIESKKVRRAEIEDRIGSREIYRCISDIITNHSPTLVIIIDERTKELEDVCDTLSRSFETKVVEFKTFEREGIGPSVHAHLFEPLVTPIQVPPSTTSTKGEKADEAHVTLGGQRVRITKEDIIRASSDPKIQEFSYKTKYVDIEGRKYPVKGLVSIATGVSIDKFVTTAAQSILEKLGFRIVETR